jgi:hypothetical protein
MGNVFPLLCKYLLLRRPSLHFVYYVRTWWKCSGANRESREYIICLCHTGLMQSRNLSCAKSRFFPGVLVLATKFAKIRLPTICYDFLISLWQDVCHSLDSMTAFLLFLESLRCLATTQTGEIPGPM